MKISDIESLKEELVEELSAKLAEVNIHHTKSLLGHTFDCFIEKIIDEYGHEFEDVQIKGVA